MDIEAVFPAGYEKVEVLNKISELKEYLLLIYRKHYRINF